MSDATAQKTFSRVSVAILSSREDIETLAGTITSAKTALRFAQGNIDVIVNGNRSLADEIAQRLHPQSTVSETTARLMRIWFVAMGDKSAAWNQYVHGIWAGSDLAFFLDGMTRVHPDALEAIARGMVSRPEAWAGTGVPTRGLSARKLRRKMLTEGGIHGNLYAVRGDILRQMVNTAFKLPLGLYRSDGLLGAAICFSLDPTHNPWNKNRIYVEANAHWDFDALKWWRPSDWKSHLLRADRQWRGVWENAAMRQWFAIDKKLPENLPATVAEFVTLWVTNQPEASNRLLNKHRHCREALEFFNQPRDWSDTTIAPSLLETQAF